MKSKYVRTSDSIQQLLDSTKYVYTPTEEEKQYDFKQFGATLQDTQKIAEMRMSRVMKFIKGDKFV